MNYKQKQLIKEVISCKYPWSYCKRGEKKVAGYEYITDNNGTLICKKKKADANNNNNNNNNTQQPDDKKLPSWYASKKSCLEQYDKTWKKTSDNQIESSNFNKKIKLFENGKVETSLLGFDYKGKWRCFNGNLEVYIENLPLKKAEMWNKTDGWETIDQSDVPQFELSQDWSEDTLKCLRSYFDTITPDGKDLKCLSEKDKPDGDSAVVKSDGSLLFYAEKTKKTYKGYWKCENGNIVIATCDDMEVLMYDGTKWAWNEEKLIAKRMGCKKEEDGGGHDGGSGRPDSTPRPSSEAVSPTPTPTPTPTPPPKVSKFTWINDSRKIMKKVIKEDDKPQTLTFNTAGGVKPELNSLLLATNSRLSTNTTSTNFFKIAQKCFPDWFIYFKDGNGNPQVVEFQDYKPVGGAGAVLGYDRNNTNNYYVWFEDFQAYSFSSKKWVQWNCESAMNYLTRMEKSELFDKFNIDYKLYGDALVKAMNKVTNILQKFIEKGAHSEDIQNWKELIEKYKPQLGGIKLFSEATDNKDLSVPDDPRELESKYNEADLTTYETNLGWKGVKIYFPKGYYDIVSDTPEGQDDTKCFNDLKRYLGFAILNAGNIEPEIPKDFQNLKTSVQKCASGGNYTNNLFVWKKNEVLGDNYKKMKNTPFGTTDTVIRWPQIRAFLYGQNATDEYTGVALPSNNPYRINLQESYLRTFIKTTLNEEIQKKKNNLLSEQIVKNRVGLLFENTEFNSVKERKIFVINLLREAFLLESQGFEKRLINEEFWDVLKGFFGEKGYESIFNSFKSRMANWITSHLSPKKKDGWIGNCIEKTIEDIEMRDIHKITDCRFLSREITRAIIEKLNEKVDNEELKDEGLYDVVRSGFSDNVKSARFKDHVESKIETMICPIIYQMSNNIDDTFSMMKSKALTK